MPERPVFATRRRVPLILQQERAECGLACVAMVAGFFDRRTGLRRLRARRPASARGTTLGDLLEVAAELGLTARPLRLELSELARLALPAVLHWRLDHFVVLVRLRRGKAVIHDPACGKRVVTRRELDASFTGVALECSPAAGFTKRDDRDRLSMIALLRSCRQLGRYVALMLLLLCLIQLLSLVPPVATQLLIDEVVLGQNLSWLRRALGGLAAVLVAVAALEALRRWIALYAGTLLAADATRGVVRHLYALPPRFLQNRHLGDLMSRLESLDPVRKAITETGVNGIVQGVIVIATLAIMLFYSPPLTLVSLGGLAASALLLAPMLPAMRRSSEQALLHQARQDSSLLESLRGSAAIHVLGLAPLRLAQWQNHFVSALNARVRLGRMLIWQGFGGNIVAAAEQVLFLGVGIDALLDRRLTLGVLFAFMTLRGRLSQAAVTLIAVCQELFLLRLHVDRLSDILLAETETPSSDGALTRSVRGSFEARQLSFRYAGGPWAVRDFSCAIRAGESVVIAGPSGCGKTTLLQLLSGQIPAGGGRLLVDDLPLPLWNRQALLRQFSVVMQDDTLFRGSLAENIAGFDPEPDLGRVRDAAAAAEIWRDIEAMPMMLETPLGDMAGTLSGGQRQRIALARAFYRRPRVLFLDEATSHLDVATEARILDHVATLDITVISVAHRPDVLRRAARVIRLAPDRPA